MSVVFCFDDGERKVGPVFEQVVDSFWFASSRFVPAHFNATVGKEVEELLTHLVERPTSVAQRGSYKPRSNFDFSHTFARFTRREILDRLQRSIALLERAELEALE